MASDTKQMVTRAGIAVPRRICVDLQTPNEAAIRRAVHAVEQAPAHPRMTDAVLLLAQALEAVADAEEALNPNLVLSTPTPAADGEAGLRPEVLAFAHEMERKLRRHDEKRGDSWRAEDVAWLLSRIGEELSELRLAVAADSDIVSEAADVANFALFVASASGKLALRARPLPPAGQECAVWCFKASCVGHCLNVGPRPLSPDVRAVVERVTEMERGAPEKYVVLLRTDVHALLAHLQRTEGA